MFPSARVLLEGLEKIHFKRDVTQSFFNAVYRDSVGAVKYLLDDGYVDVNCINYLNISALHVASQKNYVGMCQVLLSHPRINVNIRDSHGYTPLHHACKKGYLEVAKLLLADTRVDVSAVSGVQKESPLHVAAGRNDVEIIKLLLSRPEVNPQLQDEEGRTALMLCIWSIPCFLELLCDPRVDANVVDDACNSALWYACYYGLLEVVELLMVMRWGLAADQKSVVGSMDALAIAIDNGHSDVAAIMEVFTKDRERARRIINTKLGIFDRQAAATYASVVFLSDGLLKIAPAVASEKGVNAARFFAIAEKLPLDLQMILSRRVADSVKQFVLSKDSEQAFKDLARTLLTS